MKISLLGTTQAVMENPLSRHCYFGWPTVARLQDGRLAVAASGYRIGHICPFGKTVLSFSNDEGKTFSPPAPVIDTVLDDRDGGLLPFGEQGLILTSFNNSLKVQREHPRLSDYAAAYLNTLSQEEEAQAIGSSFRISRDGGQSFGALHKSPITSPHGPALLSDGSILWVGRTFSPHDVKQENDAIQAYTIEKDGSMQFKGQIPSVEIKGKELLCCEPHAIALPDGSVLCHFRVQDYPYREFFTTYQSRSHDGGKTWSKPRALLAPFGGAPSHLMLHSSGILIASYGYRATPYGIRIMFSTDLGESWDTDHILVTNPHSPDLGYPSTVELSDKSLLTVFYAHSRPIKEHPGAEILSQRWRLEE